MRMRLNETMALFRIDVLAIQLASDIAFSVKRELQDWRVSARHHSAMRTYRDLKMR